MSVRFQVTFDCADPDGLGRFWASALGYREQDPPDGFDTWEDFLRDAGVPEKEWNSASAIVDPEASGPVSISSASPRGKPPRTACTWT